MNQASSQFNYPLYEYSVGWWKTQSKNPASFLAPVVKVNGRLGTFKRFPQGSAFRAVNTLRALNTVARALDIAAEDVPYMLEDHSLRIGVDDAEIANHGPRQEAADTMAQSRMGTLLSTWRTSHIAAAFDYFRASVTAEAGKGNWTGADSNAITELRQIIEEFTNANGVMPNRILFGKTAWNILNANPQVQDMIAFNSTKTLNPARLLELLDLDGADVEEVQIMRSILPVSKHLAGVGVPFEGTNLVGAEVWLSYAKDGIELGDMSAFKTLSLGGEAIVDNVESYYNRDEHTTWYEQSMQRAFVLSAPSAVKRLTIS